MPETSSLARLLSDHPASPNDVLLYDDQSEYTAREVRAAVNTLADELRAAGVQPGNAVGLQLPNCIDAVVGMMAIWKIGGVFVPLNPRAPQSERDRAIAAVHAAALIGDDGLERVDAAPQVFAPEIAFVTWTSGTTGPPKAILHTHEGYLELLDRVLKTIPRTNGTPVQDRPPTLLPVPLALNSGIYNALFGLRAGRSLVIMERFTTGGFAALVKRFGITSTVLPPAAIAMLTSDSGIGDLSPLKYVRSITAPLSSLVARAFFDRFGVFVLNSYGQAEVGEVVGWTVAEVRAFADKIGAAGRPLPGVAIKILDADGEHVPRGEVGQLAVKPPRLAAGYATGEDLGDRLDAEGYLATGDLAHADEEGFVWISGRVGDVINRGGNKVYPAEVEDALKLSAAVADAAVTALPDERMGELPVAFVVNSPGMPAASDAELTELCREYLVAYKVPVAIYRCDALPRNEIGKLLRSELAAMLVERTR
jgi:long-chain acyl-CoA synthetase